ncbi:MAG: glycosyltransferase [Clostridia bacterium]|nr:glycosyltransferase [Clostridia bacterium]
MIKIFIKIKKAKYVFCCFFYKSYKLPSKQEVIKILEKASGQKYSKLCIINKEKIVNNKKYDLDIIVPVYNVEKYLDDCLSSILNQKTKYSIRVICINDGSTDASKSILEKWSDNDTRVFIINQENKGLSAARNVGLKHMNSKFVMFVDSDDILLEGAIDCLLDKAIETNADIVEGSYFYFNDDVGIIDEHTEKSGLITKDEMYGFPWGKLFNPNIFKKIVFPEGYWYEDTIMRYLIYIYYDKKIGIKDYVYKYRKNYLGITQTSGMSDKSADTVLVMLQTYDACLELGIKYDQEDYNSVLKHIKLSAFRMLQRSNELNFIAFTAWHYFLEEHFKDFLTKDKSLKIIEKSIRKKKYKKFIDYINYI